MGVHHNLVVSRLGDATQVVVVHELAVMVLTVGNDVTHIAALHSRIAIIDHKLIGLVEVTLVVNDGTGGFMMHDHLHALAGCIFVDALHIKIWIRSHKIKHIIFLMTEPVFPTNIPTFHQHSIETMLGSEVDVTFHILRVGGMATAGLALRVVRLAQLHTEQFVRI